MNKTLLYTLEWYIGVVFIKPGLGWRRLRLWCWRWRFALQPLVEVAPSALTGDGRRYADILSTLPSEGVEVIGGPSLVYDPTSTDNGGSESCRT